MASEEIICAREVPSPAPDSSSPAVSDPHASQNYPRSGDDRNNSVSTNRTVKLEDIKTPLSVRFEEIRTNDSREKAKTHEEHIATPLVRKWSIADDDPADKQTPRGIYWRSPNSMVAFFLIGLLACVAHHLYYSHLNRREVGSNSHQQWALRFGNTFAYIAQVCFVCSTGLAFTQYLWLTLKTTKVSVMTLDAAFEADRTILSLFDPEFVSKMKIAALLALIAWCLPLPSLITPGTLYVVPDFHSKIVQGNVTSLDMYSKSQTKLFTYSPTNTNPDGTVNYIFSGPRTILERLSLATAAQGLILLLTPPYPISSYEIQFYGPYVKCREANTTTAVIIDTLRNESMAALNSSTNYYYAFIPDFSQLNPNSGPAQGVQVVPTPRLEQRANASNQLWIVNSRYVLASGEREVVDYYQVCQLYNASYNVGISFKQGNQTVMPNHVDLLNTVNYPDPLAIGTPQIIVQHSYSAYFWAITNTIVGSMGIFYDNSNPPAWASDIDTQLEMTSLLGTSDLDPFFDASHSLYSNVSDLSAQRLDDISLAKNRTLDVLIEELSFNVTTSLLSLELLSPNVTTAINVTDSINTYAYHSKNLLLSYGLAILLALSACLIGAFAYWKNGHSHSRSFSAVLASTRAAELTGLFHAELMGRLPLHENVQRTRLVLDRWNVPEATSVGDKEKGGESGNREERLGGWGFQISHLGEANIWMKLEKWLKKKFHRK